MIKYYESFEIRWTIILEIKINESCQLHVKKLKNSLKIEKVRDDITLIFEWILYVIWHRNCRIREKRFDHELSHKDSISESRLLFKARKIYSWKPKGPRRRSNKTRSRRPMILFWYQRCTFFVADLVGVVVDVREEGHTL